jgi:hypothetical protein
VKAATDFSLSKAEGVVPRLRSIIIALLFACASQHATAGTVFVQDDQVRSVTESWHQSPLTQDQHIVIIDPGADSPERRMANVPDPATAVLSAAILSLLMIYLKRRIDFQRVAL